MGVTHYLVVDRANDRSLVACNPQVRSLLVPTTRDSWEVTCAECIRFLGMIVTLRLMDL